MDENQEVKDFVQDLISIKDMLEVKAEEKIVGIEKIENINIGGNLNKSNVFVIKMQDKDGKVYHIIADKDLNKIATIANDGIVQLSEREKKLWEEFIGKPGEQTEGQKQYYDFDKQYVLEEYNEKRKELEKKEADINQEKEEIIDTSEENKETKQEEKQIEEEPKKEDNAEEIEKKNVAKSLDVSSKQIKQIVKIEDRENFGKAIDRK